MSNVPLKTTVFIAARNAIYETDAVSVSKLDSDSAVVSKNLIAVLPDRDFVFHNFEIQRDLTREQLSESIEIKMFQDAGLNPMLDYKSAFSCRASRQDERMKAVNAAAISLGAIETGVEKLKKNVSYIDAILPTTTLPYALYNAEILERKKDVFVYFQKDALIVSIFDSGELVYGKVQDNGIRKLHDSFEILSGNKDDYASFVKTLLNIEKLSFETDKQTLSDLREVLFNSLNSIKNILLYASRISGVNEFDRLFIGSCEGVITGLSDLAQELFEVESHDFNFFTEFHTQDEDYLDQIALLALLEGQNRANGLPENPYNVTPYARPGKFLTRKGGKALFFVAAAVLATFIWPMYYQSQIWFFEAKTQKALSEIGKSKPEFEANIALRDSLLAERESLIKQKDQVEGDYVSLKKQLDEIHKRRTKEKTVAVNLSTIFDDIVKSNLLIDSFNVTQRDLNLSLISSQDTQITTLLNTLVEDGYELELHEILKSEDGSYKAELKVGLK